MSKRGMRAAGVCLVTVAVMSGSVVADGAVASSDSTQKLAAEDFSVTMQAQTRFDDDVREVVLRRGGVRTGVHFTIVVTHPATLDRVDFVTLDFARGSGHGYKHFRMRGDAPGRESSTSTGLVGTSSFATRYRGARAHVRPGSYEVIGATVGVTEDGQSSEFRVAQASGKLRVLYRSRTTLESESAAGRRVRLEGRVRGYNGSLADVSDQWSAVVDAEVGLYCTRPKRKWTPVVVKSVRVTTDGDGRFATGPLSCDRGTRWYASFESRLLDGSHSAAVSAT